MSELLPTSGAPVMTTDCPLGPTGLLPSSPTPPFDGTPLYPRVRYHNIILEDEIITSDEETTSQKANGLKHFQASTKKSGFDSSGCAFAASQAKPLASLNDFFVENHANKPRLQNGSVTEDEKCQNSLMTKLGAPVNGLKQNNSAGDASKLGARKYGCLLGNERTISSDTRPSSLLSSDSAGANNRSTLNGVIYNGRKSPLTASPELSVSTPTNTSYGSMSSSCLDLAPNCTDAASEGVSPTFQHLQVFPCNLHCVDSNGGVVSEANHTHGSSAFMGPSMNGMQLTPRSTLTGRRCHADPSSGSDAASKPDMPANSSRLNPNNCSKKYIQSVADGLSSLNVFGEDGSDFEYKKYMRLLRSNSFGSVSEINGGFFSVSPGCSQKNNPSKDVSSSILVNHLRSAGSAPSNKLGENGRKSVASRIETPEITKKSSWLGTNGVKHGRLFSTVTDIDIGDGDNDTKEKTKTVSNFSDALHKLHNASDGWKGVTSDLTPSKTSSNAVPRRNSIAFSGQWSDLGSTNATDWLYHRNGLSQSVFSPFSSDVNRLLPVSDSKPPPDYDSVRKRMECKSNKDRKCDKKVNNNRNKHSNSEIDRSSGPIPYENWKNAVRGDSLNISESDTPYLDARKNGFYQTISEFNAFNKGMYTVVDEEEPSESADKACNADELDSVSRLLESLPVNSLKTRRRNSISGVSGSERDDSSYTNSFSNNLESRGNDKFVFGGRRNTKMGANLRSREGAPIVKSAGFGQSNLSSCSKEASERLFPSFDDIVNQCPSGNRETLNNENTSMVGRNSSSSRKPKSPRRVDLDSPEGKQLQRLINNGSRLRETSGSVRVTRSANIIPSAREVLSVLPSYSKVDEYAREDDTKSNCTKENSLFSNRGNQCRENQPLINNTANSNLRSQLGRFPTDELDDSNLSNKRVSGTSSALDSGRTKVNHSFGPKNFQNSLQNLSNIGVEKNPRGSNGDFDSTPDAGSPAKVSSTRKVARRMTTTGLVRPALQKFVALGAQRLLKKPEQFQKILFSHDDEKLVSNPNEKVSCKSNSNGTFGVSQGGGSECFSRNGVNSSYNSLVDIASDDKRSESSETSGSSSGQQSYLSMNHSSEKASLLNNTCVPPAVRRPPRRNKNARKMKLTDESVCKVSSPSSITEEKYLHDRGSSSAHGCNSRLASPELGGSCGGADIAFVQRGRDVGTPVDSPGNSRRILNARNKISSSEKGSNVKKKLLNKVRKRLKSGSRSMDGNSVAEAHRDSREGGTSEESEHGLITIRIRPDTVGKFAGKFGFNVKGGADQDAPVLVSKVTAGSPADTCFPRLNEGDQVLLINGREVSSMTHDQVVNSIKASRECHSGELVLTVKQNVYEGDEGERDVEYVLENGAQAASENFVAAARLPHKLEESMVRLHQDLRSGALVAEFETRYRINPALRMDIAKWSCNEARNRYRDISPYDKTRVVLRDDGSETPFNDYINASYVEMEVQGTKIVNKYIASQGPLSTTLGHFWLMVWQQQCLLLVMLTTCIEQGRTKCRQYWPDVNSTADYGAISVHCDEQKTKSGGFIWRQFTVKHKSSDEKRKIQHLQYVTWPDHGVPEQSNDFLTFVQEVRWIRAEDRENKHPVLVHCSAGIGRTGVLILMETSQCLIEANQPIIPEDLVMKMRDQRPMMIQTSGQFRFVCEAIHRVYDEKIVRPLSQDGSR